MSRVETLDRLNADQLHAGVRSAVIGRHIVVVEQTGSTNDAILRFASPQGTPTSRPAYRVDEGLVLFAEHQTAGRGQRGNRWESTAGKGLWLSILLRPKIDITSSPRLTFWAA